MPTLPNSDDDSAHETDQNVDHDADADFLSATADRLAALPAVEAVALGGSRAQGTHTAGSDWDLAVYYRGAFDPADLRSVGWEGEVSEIGGWGGGVFNGGAWLTIDGRKVDVHYRDLDVVEHELAEAKAGRFRVEPLLFHLAGIPSYLVVAELAVNQVLRGELPRPEGYPAETSPDRLGALGRHRPGDPGLRQGQPRPAVPSHRGGRRAGHRRRASRPRGAGGARRVGDERETAAGAGRTAPDRRGDGRAATGPGNAGRRDRGGGAHHRPSDPAVTRERHRPTPRLRS